MQDGSNSSALAVELLQSCAKPSIYAGKPLDVHNQQRWKIIAIFINNSAILSVDMYRQEFAKDTLWQKEKKHINHIKSERRDNLL